MVLHFWNNWNESREPLVFYFWKNSKRLMASDVSLLEESARILRVSAVLFFEDYEKYWGFLVFCFWENLKESGGP